MKLLSVCGIYHDLNISYYDGTCVHYLKAERKLQIKHFFDKEIFNLGNTFEQYIQEYLGIGVSEIDAICLESATFGYNGIDSRELFASQLYTKYRDKIFVVDHHYLHALSTTILGFEPDISIVIDGQGAEYSWSVFDHDSRVEYGIGLEHGSIGYGITFLATQMGVTGHILDLSGKLMGLQSYGKVDTTYYNSLQQYNIYNLGSKINRFDGYRTAEYGMYDISKYPGDKLDAAKTLHQKTENIICDLFAKYADKNTKIAYSGGVAQNVIWNTKLKDLYPNLEILPHCADEGLSVGGLEFLRRHFNLKPFCYDKFPYMQSDTDTEIASSDTIQKTAEYLQQGKIVAWYQNNGEVGPRALGNRSILMDPRIPNARDTINKIKRREYYRPFGASVLEEYAKEYFNLKYSNPYMLYVGTTQVPGLEAITHVDGTCRVQTVHSGQFRELLQQFYNLTNCPVVLNTSLNISGKPIAGSHEDAITEFTNTDIDVLVIGDTVYNK